MPSGWGSALAGATALLAVTVAVNGPAGAQQTARVTIAATPGSLTELRQWDARITRMERSGDLRMRQVREDTQIAGRTHERLDQYYRGVRVFGADVARQIDGAQMVSAFGTLYEELAIDTAATITADLAREAIEAREGISLPPALRPELVILPLEAGGYALTWRIRAASPRGVRQYFVDAHTGSIAFEYSDLKTQTVGRGRGVLGDSKKISVTSSSGRFVTDDGLRPPSLKTYDMRGDYARVLDYLEGAISLDDGSDLGADADNDWTDGALVDAHVYAGFTYDYFFKRFNRRGLDDRDIPIVSLVHPVRRIEVFDLFDELDLFFTNAFYWGDGIMVYGVGLPAGVTLGGKAWDHTSGALDIVAHELSHGVTDYSSALIYMNESGALNESFSDIMATGAEFFFQQPGNGSRQADYVIGEDVIRPGGLRSMADPGAFGDPDHYSIRFRGSADNGGVHINSGISNQAFYLAVEGGTNRTSGLGVQGVGAPNREQIERVFFRAYTQMLPANATFAIARTATIQAARDLYPSNTTVERAVTEAWTAVGVN
jgi:thermolysin